MKIKTEELIGATLDWAVAKAEGLLEPLHSFPHASICMVSGRRVCLRYSESEDNDFAPSTYWVQGGEIIEREGISVMCINMATLKEWQATYCNPWIPGSTPLIAAMRCYVAKKLGDEVDVPDALVGK